jgi:hypothetical protein
MTTTRYASDTTVAPEKSRDDGELPLFDLDE